MHVGAALRLLRLDSGLGLRDLARRLGVSSAYLSRVESGLDPAPTPARLEALARELGLPAPLVLGLARRMSPLVPDYVDAVPEAGALFLEIAHRRLGPAELAELRTFVERRFPSAASNGASPRLSDGLAPDRVVLGLAGAAMEDLFDVAAGRLAAATSTSVAALAAALRQREAEIGSALGGGVAVPCAHLRDAQPAAALLTLAQPVPHETPDGVPLRVVVVLAGPPASETRAARLAAVARLAALGLAARLEGVTAPAEALARVAELEG